VTSLDSLRTNPVSALLTYSFYLYYGKAKDSPNQAQRRLWNQRFSASPHPPTSHSLAPSPHELMWQHIKADYIPSTHPSALACQPPDNGKPVAAIRGALKTHSRIITSSVIRIATGHCFDAHYSQRFRSGADDTLLCPCSSNLTHPHLHTRHHILFQCARFAKERRRFHSTPTETPKPYSNPKSLPKG
jgi:hypothetical protein